MTTFSGSSNNIQRKVRRAYDYMKTQNPDVIKQMPESFFSTLLKGIFIAIDEDQTDHGTIKTGNNITGIIEQDTSTESSLDSIPYDKEV